MSYIEGKFSPIVLVGMSRHNLLGEVKRCYRKV